MSTPVVVFEGVSKKFRRGERHDSLRDLIPSLTESPRTPMSRELESADDFWAVRDVQFEAARRSARHHRPQRRRKIDHAQATDAYPAPYARHCQIRGRVGD